MRLNMWPNLQILTHSVGTGTSTLQGRKPRPRMARYHVQCHRLRNSRALPSCSPVYCLPAAAGTPGHWGTSHETTSSWFQTKQEFQNSLLSCLHWSLSSSKEIYDKAQSSREAWSLLLLQPSLVPLSQSRALLTEDHVCTSKVLSFNVPVFTLLACSFRGGPYQFSVLRLHLVKPRRRKLYLRERRCNTNKGLDHPF